MFFILFIILMLQVIAAFCFCTKKTGFHYDEYYSYYSSNVTYGLVPSDREWKPQAEIVSEFEVAPEERFNFATVVRMQSYDVHPPFYYILLHTVCSLTPGLFTKWSALILNMVLFVGSWILLAALTNRLATAVLSAMSGINADKTGEEEQKTAKAATIIVCLLYGFNPAVLSGVMMARMYILLGFLVMAVTLLHVIALINRRRCWKFYVLTMLCVYLGFLTHYYYAVYMFFLAAAMEFFLLFETAEGKSWGAKWKDCFVYGFAVVGAMVLAVLSYPSCLGHIFRGYRGTEAMGEFFNAGNTIGRIRFFVGLLNEYVFGDMLPFVMLVIVLLVLTIWTSGRMTKKSSDTKKRMTEKTVHRAERYHVLWITAVAVAGYFLVVTKTALLNAEEANRYPLPVYGMILMFSVLIAVMLLEKCFPKLSGKWKTAAAGAVFFVVLAGEINGVFNGKVLFLYEEDAPVIAFAQENHDVPVIHLYNGNLMWMIWDESLELMQYDEIYFVNKSDLSPIEDENLAEAERALVYVMRGEDQGAALEIARCAVGEDAQVNILRELLYCDLYEIKK